MSANIMYSSHVLRTLSICNLLQPIISAIQHCIFHNVTYFSVVYDWVKVLLVLPIFLYFRSLKCQPFFLVFHYIFYYFLYEDSRIEKTQHLLSKPAITEFNSFRKLISNMLQHHFEHLRYDRRKCDLKRTQNLVQWMI